MPSPIIKIKQGNGRPQQYSGPGNGLTAGELGVDLTNYAFYIGNSTGSAITFGAEVTTDSTFAAASDNKIPTQNAVKQYVDAFSSVTSSSSFVSIKHNSTSANQTIPPITSIPIAWSNETASSSPNLLSSPGLASSIDFSNGNLINQLTYTGEDSTSANNGKRRFINSSGSTLYLLINYQIPISPPTSEVGYNSALLLKSAWIQKFAASSNSIPSPNNSVYGFANITISPLIGSTPGAISCVLSGSAIIRLANSESFNIFFRNHASGTGNQNTIPHSIKFNNGGGINSQDFTDGLRLQILKL